MTDPRYRCRGPENRIASFEPHRIHLKGELPCGQTRPEKQAHQIVTIQVVEAGECKSKLLPLRSGNKGLDGWRKAAAGREHHHVVSPAVAFGPETYGLFGGKVCRRHGLRTGIEHGARPGDWKILRH